jgi:hypothetical protein
MYSEVHCAVASSTSILHTGSIAMIDLLRVLVWPPTIGNAIERALPAGGFYGLKGYPAPIQARKPPSRLLTFV